MCFMRVAADTEWISAFISAPLAESAAVIDVVGAGLVRVEAWRTGMTTPENHASRDVASCLVSTLLMAPESVSRAFFHAKLS